MYRIYSITCPITKMIIYVGMTKQPIDVRAYSHMSERCYQNKKKEFYFKMLRRMGYSVCAELLDRTMSESEARRLEVFWIHQMKQWGFPLLNKGQVKNRMMPKHYFNPEHASKKLKRYIQ